MPSALTDRGPSIGIVRVEKGRHSFTPHQNTEWDCDHDPPAAASPCGTAVTAGQAGYVDEAFAFTGRWLDKATGLQNNLNRWYDSTSGRWLSEDPIGFAAGDANLYQYVGNEPTRYSDPSGLDPPPGDPSLIIRPGDIRLHQPLRNHIDDRPLQRVIIGPGDAAAGIFVGVPGSIGRLIGSIWGCFRGNEIDDGFPLDHVFHGDQPHGPIGPGDGSFQIPKPGWMKK